VTCIVALETGRGVWMGADRAASDSFTTSSMGVPKIYRNGPALIADCGDFRTGQLLQYALKVPKLPQDADLDRWVAVDLTTAIRSAFRENGWKRRDHGVDEATNLLFAIRGRCYEIQSDYSFLRNESGEYAIGSGTYHSLGSLHTSRGWAKPKDRVLAALEAAAEHVVSVAGPFDVVRQPRTGI
jgi:hypothetical protein